MKSVNGYAPLLPRSPLQSIGNSVTLRERPQLSGGLTSSLSFY
jgi:hypothetical protein